MTGLRGDQLLPHVNALLEHVPPDVDDETVAALVRTTDRTARLLVRSWNLSAAEELARHGLHIAGSRSALIRQPVLRLQFAMADAISKQGRDFDAEGTVPELARESTGRPACPASESLRNPTGTRHCCGVSKRIPRGRTDVPATSARTSSAAGARTAQTRSQPGTGSPSRFGCTAAEPTLNPCSVGFWKTALGPVATIARILVAARHGIAWSLGLQGRYPEAEQIIRQVIADRRRLLGTNSAKTLASMYRLAWIIAGQGRHAEAEALYVKILARQREILGSDHQSTLRTWYRLARSISAQQGRASEAEEHFRLVLAARRQVLGSDHQATLRARFRVALANVQLRRLDEAIGELRTVIAVQRRILGDDHGDTRDSVRELAGLTPESADSILGSARSSKLTFPGATPFVPLSTPMQSGSASKRSARRLSLCARVGPI